MKLETLWKTQFEINIEDFFSETIKHPNWFSEQICWTKLRLFKRIRLSVRENKVLRLLWNTELEIDKKLFSKENIEKSAELFTKEQNSTFISISGFSKVKRRPPSIDVLFTKELFNNSRKPFRNIEKIPPLFFAEFSFILSKIKKIEFFQMKLEMNFKMTVFYQ